MVRIFAILDRRVGKRKIIAMKETIANEPETFREFYSIRAGAENIYFLEIQIENFSRRKVSNI